MFESAEETCDTDVTSIVCLGLRARRQHGHFASRCDVTSDAAPTSVSSPAESTSVDSDSSTDSSADIHIYDPTVFVNRVQFYELPDYYFKK